MIFGINYWFGKIEFVALTDCFCQISVELDTLWMKHFDKISYLLYLSFNTANCCHKRNKCYQFFEFLFLVKFYIAPPKRHMMLPIRISNKSSIRGVRSSMCDSYSIDKNICVHSLDNEFQRMKKKWQKGDKSKCIKHTPLISSSLPNETCFV